MNILFLTDTYLPQINGVAISIRSFSEQLEKQGHSVTIIGPKTEKNQESTAKLWRFKSFPFPFQPEYRIISPLSKKLKHFEKNNFDIIHIHTPFFMGHLGQFLSWKYNIPMIHTYHTLWADYLHYFPILPEKICKKMDLFLLSKNFCNRCSQILVPSEPIKQTLLEYKVSKPITILPTGIDTSITISNKQIETFKKKWALPNNKDIIVFVGRLGIEKNIYFLVETFKSIFKNQSNTHLLIIGDGPERENISQYISKLSLTDHVTLTGYLDQTDVFAGIMASKIISFPSTSETQGLSLLEGLNLGKPAVCINQKGVKEIIRNDQGGFLTDGTKTHYVEAALSLLTQPELYEKKSKEAKLRALDFSAPTLTKKLITIYNKTVKDYSKK